MVNIEFQAWPKTSRLFRETMVVTEKIDGTNAAVGIVSADQAVTGSIPQTMFLMVDGDPYLIYAQSRKRLIAPEDDNYGFAAWVYANADGLVRTLGEGLHFGEWWGQGIQRRYDMDHKRFSLFNTRRWTRETEDGRREPSPELSHHGVAGLDVVPVLGVHAIDTTVIHDHMLTLAACGSQAAPGFMRPEGICVYLPGIDKVFKVTFDGDKPKYLAALAAQEEAK